MRVLVVIIPDGKEVADVRDCFLIDSGERTWLQVEVEGVQRVSYLGRVNLESLRGLATSRGIDLVETFERVQGADGLWRKVARRTVAERK
jgi:hypothetical protein